MLIEIVPYVLGATISPVVLAVMVVLLAQKKQPLLQGLVFFMGGLLAAIPIGALVFYAVHTQQGQASRPSLSADMIHIVVGLVLFVLAYRAWTKTPKKTKHKAASKVHLARDFALGMVLVASDVSSLIMFVPAGLTLQDAAADVRLAGLGLLIVALTMAMWLPLLAVMLLGDKGRQLLGVANKLMTKHGQQITAVVIGLIALYELYKGISGL